MGSRHGKEVLKVTTSFKVQRVKAGLTQKEAAEKLGIQVPRLSSYERGITEPKASVVARMIKLYDCTLDDFPELQ